MWHLNSLPWPRTHWPYLCHLSPPLLISSLRLAPIQPTNLIFWTKVLSTQEESESTTSSAMIPLSKSMSLRHPNYPREWFRPLSCIRNSTPFAMTKTAPQAVPATVTNAEVTMMLVMDTSARRSRFDHEKSMAFMKCGCIFSEIGSARGTLQLHGGRWNWWPRRRERQANGGVETIMLQPTILVMYLHRT